MSDPYIGEIRLFGGNFAPVGWSFCDGTLYAISMWETLFNLIGTTYGGDGQTTFAVPDLRGRLPVHRTNIYPMGIPFGTETVTLTPQNLPAHSHSFTVSQSPANSGIPTNSVLADAGTAGGVKMYFEDKPTVPMSTLGVDPVGGTAPHNNMQPFLCVNYIIAMDGIYPTPS
jgi:microcystin-dependent protein